MRLFIFGLLLAISYAQTEFYPPAGSLTCEAALNEWCARNTPYKYARFDRAYSSPTKQWRCYSTGALTADTFHVNTENMPSNSGEVTCTSGIPRGTRDPLDATCWNHWTRNSQLSGLLEDCSQRIAKSIDIYSFIDTSCPSGTRQCDNGQCIPDRLFCNGHKDHGNAAWSHHCADASDEILEVCCAENAAVYKDKCKNLKPPSKMFTFQLRGNVGGEQVEINLMPQPFNRRKNMRFSGSVYIQKVTLTSVWKTFSCDEQIIEIKFKNPGTSKEVYFKSDDAGLVFHEQTWREEKCEDKNAGAICQDVREGKFKKSGTYTIEFNGIPVLYGVNNAMPHGCESIGRTITTEDECIYATNFLEYYYFKFGEKQPHWPTGCFLYDDGLKYSVTFNRGDPGIPTGPTSRYPWLREICVVGGPDARNQFEKSFGGRRKL